MEEEKEQYIQESKRTQTIVVVIVGSLLLLLFCPPVFMIGFICAVVFGLISFIIQLCIHLIKRIPVKNLTEKTIKNLIMIGGYFLVFAEKYKKDWFRYSLIIVLGLIAIALLRMAF